MTNYEKYLKKADELSNAKEWVENSNKIDSQDSRRYQKVINVSTDVFKYCGQSTVGARNYHKCDENFTKYISTILEHNFSNIVNDALARLTGDVNKLRIEAKSEMESHLKQLSEEVPTKNMEKTK